MAASPDSAAALLAELNSRGIELEPAADKLRYRPRSALTPALKERLKTHKEDLLELLRNDRWPQVLPKRQDRPNAPVVPSKDDIGQAQQLNGVSVPEAPHELSFAERIATGYVNPGWTPKAWANRLRQLADRCEALHPELASQYRRWAGNVSKNERGFA